MNIYKSLQSHNIKIIFNRNLNRLLCLERCTAVTKWKLPKKSKSQPFLRKGLIMWSLWRTNKILRLATQWNHDYNLEKSGWFVECLLETLHHVEWEFLVELYIIANAWQQVHAKPLDQPLAHIRCKHSRRLKHGRRAPFVWRHHVQYVLPVSQAREQFECLIDNEVKIGIQIFWIFFCLYFKIFKKFIK